jgi:NADH-quinone oxidoreductase subunit N
MALGAFAAIGQKNIKRLMAYSSIGHMGFALVGLAANSEAGVRGVAIYMLIYLVMTLGTFAFILAMRRKDGNVEQISDLAGLVDQSRHGDDHDHPDVLAGRHPAARRLLGQVVRLPRRDRRRTLRARGHRRAGFGGGAFYYLRIIKIMWFDEPVGGFQPMAGELRLVLGLSGAFVLFYVVIGGPIGQMAEAAAKTFF